MNRILVLAPHWIGDALFTTSALRRIKEQYPHSECYVLAVPRAAEVFARNPDVAKILINEQELRSFWYFFALTQKIGRLDFDAVFLFHRSRSRAVCTFLAGIPLRIGYNTKGRGIFLTHAVELPGRVMHRVESLNHLLHEVGMPGKAPAPRFFVGDATRAAIKERLREFVGHEKFAILNPGGNWLPKRWPAERFARLAGLLRSQMALRIVITGSAKDKILAEEIQRGAETFTPVLSLAGQTTLEELGAVIEAAEIFISNDSGPLHLAAALGTPVIGLFGPTSAKITGPVGDGKIVILQKDIGLPVPNPDPNSRDMRYMEAIEVEDVFQAAENILTQDSITHSGDRNNVWLSPSSLQAKETIYISHPLPKKGRG